MVRERLRRFLRPVRLGDRSAFALLLPQTPSGDTSLIPYRVVTAGAVVVSVTAAVTQEAVVGSAGIAALVLVPVGFVFSFVRRGKRNILLKIFLTVGLFAAFAGFLNGVRGALNVDDTRAPLVAVFLWVQVLHSFDVPRARDLTFSVAASVALIALAGSLAFTTGFIVLVLIFAVFFLSALVLGHEADLRDGAPAPLAREVTQRRSADSAGARRFRLFRPVAGLIAGTFFCTAVVFVFLPRLGGSQFAALPFSFVLRTPIAGFTGDVVNPGSSDRDRGAEAGFDANAYFGYGDSLDLHVRGQLAEDLVMRVRSPRPAMYRGQVYDVYEKGKWTSSDKDLQEVRGSGLGSLPVPSGIEAPNQVGPELVQTFYVERELPNIIFHTYKAQEVYVSSSSALVDDFSSIRIPFTLEKDTIYSVVSHVPDVTPEALRGAPSIDQIPQIARREALERYMQVPDSLGGRFSELARTITRPHPAVVDKAQAVDRWLSDNKKYNVDISRDPPGKDPVDFFVFDRDEGFCEQIATTMVLMLRASGVPARIVTGFGPGQRNLFTGYWEVLNSDAHAWVEVFYPGAGWITYDPTFGVPASSLGDTTFMFEPLRRLAGDVFQFDAVRDLAAKGVDAVRAAPVVGAVVILLILATLISAMRWGISVARPRARSPGPAVAAWLEIERALASRGQHRAEAETALEFARRVRPLLGDKGGVVEELAEAFGEVRYGVRPEPQVEEWAIRAGETARAVRTQR